MRLTLLRYGYNDNQISRIMDHFSTTNKELVDIIQYLEFLGLTKQEIINMTSANPKLFKIGLDKLKDNVNELYKIVNQDDSKIIRFIKSTFGTMVLSNGIGILEKKSKVFECEGYSKEQSIRILLEQPSVGILRSEIIQRKILLLKKLGRTSEEIILLTSSHPEIFLYSELSLAENANELFLDNTQKIENVKQNFTSSVQGSEQDLDEVGPTIFLSEKERIVAIMQTLKFVGYTEEQIIEMTSSFHRFGYKKEELISMFNTLKEQDVELQNKEKYKQALVGKKYPLSEEVMSNSLDTNFEYVKDISVISDKEYQRRINSILNENSEETKELKKYAIRKIKK